MTGYLHNSFLQLIYYNFQSTRFKMFLKKTDNMFLITEETQHSVQY